MKIIRTAKYKKLAGIDPKLIGAAILGVSMTAKKVFKQPFVALDRVGTMLYTNGKMDFEILPEVINEIDYIIELQEANLGALDDGYYETFEKIPAWLSQIREQQELDDQYFGTPYDLDNTGGYN